MAPLRLVYALADMHRSFVFLQGTPLLRLLTESATLRLRKIFRQSGNAYCQETVLIVLTEEHLAYVGQNLAASQIQRQARGDLIALLGPPTLRLAQVCEMLEALPLASDSAFQWHITRLS